MTTGADRCSGIREFLLAYVLGEDDDADPESDHGRRRRLRAEVERHEARTMAVISGGSSQTLTRCRSCASEPTWPCVALRVLALPYARHPAYRPEWGIGAVEER